MEKCQDAVGSRVLWGRRGAAPGTHNDAPVPGEDAANVLRNGHMARSESPSANLVLRFTLSAIETLKPAGFGCKRKFLEETVDHFEVGQRPITVF